MTAPHDEGYILASAIGVLLAISIVAAALVGASGESLSRVRRGENAAKLEATLESAMTLVATQLVVDPRRRNIKLAPKASFAIFDHPIKVQIAWENSKLDVNLSEVEMIDTRLRRSDLSEKSRDRVLASIRRSRETSQPIRLITELKGDEFEQTCLSSLLTVFGGQTTFDPELKAEPPVIGRPPSGSRLAIDLAAADAEAKGLSAVILITGDPQTPWKVMDWRRTSSLAGEPCHAA